MKPEQLSLGNVYFMVTFHDQDLLVPDITTYIYIGCDLLQDDSKLKTFFFQGAEKYIEFGVWHEGLDAIDSDVMTMQAEFLEYVFDYEGLQEQLETMRCGGASYNPD